MLPTSDAESTTDARAGSCTDTHRRAVFFEGVVGRDFKERARRFAPVDASEAVARLAEARVGVLAHHNELEFRRVPAFGDDVERAFVADGPGGDDESRARAFGFDALD